MNTRLNIGFNVLLLIGCLPLNVFAQEPVDTLMVQRIESEAKHQV